MSLIRPLQVLLYKSQKPKYEKWDIHTSLNSLNHRFPVELLQCCLFFSTGAFIGERLNIFNLISKKTPKTYNALKVSASKSSDKQGNKVIYLCKLHPLCSSRGICPQQTWCSNGSLSTGATRSYWGKWITAVDSYTSAWQLHTVDGAFSSLSRATATVPDLHGWLIHPVISGRD